MSRAAAQHLVMHAGALGDFVLIWPLLRALLTDGDGVTLIAAPSHAGLAERVLGSPLLRAVSSELRAVTRLWREDDVGPEDIAAWRKLLAGHSMSRVFSFVATDGSSGSQAFHRRLSNCTGAPRVDCVGPPGSDSRADVWNELNVHARGRVAARTGVEGSVVMHVGAGSRAKRWPLPCWAQLVTAIRPRVRVTVIAGEVEAEQFTPAERRMFANLGGELPGDLEELVNVLAPGRTTVFIGADTGPTHLAAQLGIPTVALFGPTDPAIWSPIGPLVNVVRARTGTMADLSTEDVLEAFSALAVEL